MKKSFKKKLLIFVTILTVLFLTVYFKYQRDISFPVDSANKENITFLIKKGDTARIIADNLEDKNIIRSGGSFYLYTKFHHFGEGILAGRFNLNKSLTVPEIIQIISDPKQAEFVITIQEGITAKDIDKKLVDLNLINNGDFIFAVKNFKGWQYYDFLDQDTLSKLNIPLEGYLYPDTYFLDPAGFKPNDLIYKALDNFEKKFTPLKDKIKNHSYHQIITMAAIIENEVFGTEDRKIVSGILWKRLENNWTLGADITLLYVTSDRKLTAEELNIDSPYNTRKYQGLPPGPVGNPSLESITAAMYPKGSDYWFYLTTPDTGKVIYARTNDEQNSNRAKHL